MTCCIFGNFVCDQGQIDRDWETNNEFRMMFKFYIWVMGWSGKLNTWAWNKQVDIVRSNQRKEEEDYLKELKKKL